MVCRSSELLTATVERGTCFDKRPGVKAAVALDKGAIEVGLSHSPPKASRVS